MRIGTYIPLAICLLLSGGPAFSADAPSAEPQPGQQLFAAAGSGDLQKATAILDAHPELTKGILYAGRSALHEAARAGRAAIVSLLLQRGAEADAEDPYAGTALHYAVPTGNLQVCRLLLDAGADPNHLGPTKWSRGAPVHDAAASGRKEVLALLLERGGRADLAQVDTSMRLPSKDGQRPLHQAGSAATASLLLEKGADVKARAANGATPLHTAAARGNAEVAKLLLAAGAQVEAVDRKGMTALHMAASAPVAEALLAAGSVVGRADRDGMTALHLAAEAGRADVVSLLLEKGADPNARSSAGLTPLMAAARGGQRATASLLLDKGAEVGSATAQGATALYMAARSGKEEVVALLLDRGGATGAVTASGWNALKVAAENGHTGIVKLLEGRGASRPAPDGLAEKTLPSVPAGSGPLSRAGMPRDENLPAPPDLAAPAGSPPPPGDRFAPLFSSQPVNPRAPQLAAWNVTALPGESLTLTGARLTLRQGTVAGSDTTAWLWADTPAGGKLCRLQTAAVAENVMTVFLPRDIPRGMYLVWVENQAGPGYPVPVNRTLPQWLGPFAGTVKSGGRTRVFGRNMSWRHEGEISHVLLRSGGGKMIAAAVKKVEPYSVEFQLPEGLADGEYGVYVHNGHGGGFGWGGPLKMSVRNSPWSRNDREIVLKPSGQDDWPAMQKAVDELTSAEDGGTLRLTPGTYAISRQLDLKSGVRLAGAGREDTTLELRFKNGIGGHLQHSGVRFFGSNIALEDMTIKVCRDEQSPRYGIFNSEWPGMNSNLRLAGLRWTGEPGTQAGNMGLRTWGLELTGCEGYRGLGLGGADHWIHDNHFLGNPYEGGGAEAPLNPNSLDRFIIERNHFETKDWPVGPGGSRNYHEFLSKEERAGRMHTKRMVSAGIGVGSSQHSYMAWNTSKDVAVEDNKGEVFLLHGMDGAWYGLAASSSATMVRLKTEAPEYSPYSRRQQRPGGPVPDKAGHGGPLDGEAWAVIVAGSGLGQYRLVTAHTKDSITVASPWRVPPDATSWIVITYVYADQIIYRNEINAFPEGYIPRGHTASTGIQLDGNSLGVVAEGNVSRRTYYGRTLAGHVTAPTFWNEFRDEKVLQASFTGPMLMMWAYQTPSFPGAVTLGNMYRGGEVEVAGPWPGDTRIGLFSSIVSHEPIHDSPVHNPLAAHVGNVFEHVRARGGRIGIRDYRLSDTIYRENVIQVTDVGPQRPPAGPAPVYVEQYAHPLLMGNNYAGGTEGDRFTAPEALYGGRLLPLYRTVRLKGKKGTAMSTDRLTLLNAGIASIRWEARSETPWVLLKGLKGGLLPPEGEAELVVGADASKLPPGVHWGRLRLVSDEGAEVIIGVRAEITAG